MPNREGLARIGYASRARGAVSRGELAIVIHPSSPADIVRPSITRADRPGWVLWVASLPARLWSKLFPRHEQRWASWALESLNDNMLKDIGISRADVEYLRYGGETKHVIR
jgi:uncharacterized protein YjiS (DUF1127 family)